MNTNKKLNMTMLCDFYELTMGNGYFKAGYKDRITHFDLFFRSVPDNGGYAIAAGLEQVIEYIQDLHFDPEDIAYLRGRKIFDEDFLDYLANFKFTGDIFAIPEGTPVFPNEPILTVRAPAIQAQLMETLPAADHQPPEPDRHQGQPDRPGGPGADGAGVRLPPGPGSRTAPSPAPGRPYIGGCKGTACTISDQLYGVPAGGTMAHAWVQTFDTQYEAFRAYCEIYPENAVLLVDTYNTLESGVPDAIRAFNDVLKPKGITKCGIRLDSGDMAYLTQKARQMLDEAGWTECTITVSNSLDEFIIQDLLLQGAQINTFGVGERLITARSEPVFGGVYKLVAYEDDQGNVIPKIKLSENVSKITTPQYKKVYRLYGGETGKAIGDWLCTYDEDVDSNRNPDGSLTIFDPDATWKKKTIHNFVAKPLQVPIFLGGKLVYQLPKLEEIQQYCSDQMDTLWDEVKRFDNPHNYYVDLSQKLWNTKYDLITHHK